MAENSTVARPYARAVFELAHEAGRFPAWSAFLERAATVVMDERVAGLIDSPRLSRSELAELMIDLAGDEAGEQGHNLIRVLAENDRLGILPEITAEYAVLRDAAAFISPSSLSLPFPPSSSLSLPSLASPSSLPLSLSLR